MLEDPLHGQCLRELALHDHVCDGRITFEHAMMHGGRQVDEAWAIVFLCEKAHGVGRWMDTGLLNKEINRWIALNRATDEDLKKYPRTNWLQERAYLNGKYGKLSTD